jgi:hypothetical protein
VKAAAAPIPALFFNFLREDAPTPYLVISANDARQRFRVDAMLFEEYARRQSFDRIIVLDGHDLLRDDRPTVQHLVNEMNCAASPFDSMLQGLPLRIEAGKGRQQGRMNIENASAKSLYELGREQSHITGQADQINRASAKGSDCFPVMQDSRAPAPLNEERLKASLGGARETLCVFLVADDDRDLSFRKTPFADGTGKRQHVRAAPGDQNSDAADFSIDHLRSRPSASLQ